MIKKRNGQRQEFVVEKIVVSAVKSGAPPTSARRIAKEIEMSVKEGSSSDDIRKMVLDKMNSENRQWAEDWRRYDREVKKRAA